MPLSAPICHLMKCSKGKLPETIFYLLNEDASRSKCSFKVKGSAVPLNDGVECKYHANLEIVTKSVRPSNFEGNADFVTILIKQKDT